MIETRVYRCGNGCCRESAAPLELSKCCAHGRTWVVIHNSTRKIRTDSDPPGTPLFVEVDDAANGEDK